MISDSDTPNHLFEKLKLTLTGSPRLTSDDDMDRIQKAFEFSKDAHLGQTRKSGGPFLEHPVTVAIYVAEIHPDTNTIIATLLHDTVEDTRIDIKDIRDKFGDNVADTVGSLTALTYKELDLSEDLLPKEYLDRITFVAKIRNAPYEVRLIKLLDRLHNMRTISHMPSHQRIKKAKETQDLYVQMAEDLGLWRIKRELEDLSFQQTHCTEFQQTLKKVYKNYDQAKEYMYRNAEFLKSELTKNSINNSDILINPKHTYSLYDKMRDKDFDHISNLFSLLVVVGTEKDCYNVLGVIHRIWLHKEGKLRDYIGAPKKNSYRSIHTSVVSEDDHYINVQIRTTKMQRSAEYGVFA